MRAAAIQLNSTTDKQANLEQSERLVRNAAADGADLIVLPERMNVRGDDDEYARQAEPLEGPTASCASALAAELRIDLVAGSITERREGHDKLSNTSLHFGPDGHLQAAYRKIHLFD